MEDGADRDSLLPSEVIAQATVEELEAALEQFRLMAGGFERWRRTADTRRRPVQAKGLAFALQPDAIGGETCMRT